MGDIHFANIILTCKLLPTDVWLLNFWQTDIWQTDIWQTDIWQTDIGKQTFDCWTLGWHTFCEMSFFMTDIWPTAFG
jgi:hypothetical protein